LVGTAFGRSLALALEKPSIGVHHLEGHLLSPLLGETAPQFPFIALLVSGGHTQLMGVEGVGQYQLLGETVDDAAGEAFDKTAKLLGLGYPGGPALAHLAEQGNAEAIALPRPMLHSGNLDFSFSGLKTAVLTRLKTAQSQAIVSETLAADLAAATQAAIVDVSPNGALVRIQGRNDVWLETGTDRWIHQSLVQPILSRPGMVTGSNELNVRQGPGTDFKILYRLPVSEKVTVLEEQQDWLRIGFSEWVYSGFVAFEGI
jgi:hypothetical protein